ncbi:SAM-dependent methyltransferase [Chitinivorax tropicus]|uniref:SAM-dependent methyltransferase n=1 Tax=Chitinivorax tropicus TaxID=714531 RepID=A0A840MLB6_9PROT|nr:methyltransferase [Chitinivorax tropicus]MBB5016963.1 SAM-dependent methyltransferase [Chitinivorax tropicus]
MAQDSSLPEFWETRYQSQVTPWDAGGTHPALHDWLRQRPPGRVLIPGCGTGHEVVAFAKAGWDVLAIDFSEGAIAQAQQTLGELGRHVVFGDFFRFDSGPAYDVVFERAFLCALPRSCWAEYARRQAELLKPQGLLAGFFFLKDTPTGPPFGTSQTELDQLLHADFTLLAAQPVKASVPTFDGHEWWQTWQRR